MQVTDQQRKTQLVANAYTRDMSPTSIYSNIGYYTLLFNLSSSMVKLRDIVSKQYISTYGNKSYTKSKEAIDCFTYNIVRAVKLGNKEINFSSDSNRYREVVVNGKTITTGVGFDATLNTVKLFESMGMLNRDTGYKFKGYGGFPDKSKSGTIVLTQALVELVEMNVDLEKVKIGVRNDVLLLKDTHSNALEFPSTKYTKEIIQVLTKYNKFMSKQDVMLHGTKLDTGLARIFNIDFDHGGRLYTSGHSYQGVFAGLRKDITINGYPTAEVDIKGSHISILHTMCGSRLLEGYDVYDIPMDGIADYDLDKMSFMLCTVDEKHNPFRNLVKTALLIMVNADSQQKATYSLKHKLESQLQHGIDFLEDQPDDFVATLLMYGLRDINIQKLFKAIKNKHDAIKEYFFSGAGVWLQKMEGDIFTKVIDLCLQHDYPVLVIHDSCRADVRHIKDVGRFIESAWLSVVGDTCNLKLEYEF